jgi:hypothetical protein
MFAATRLSIGIGVGGYAPAYAPGYYQPVPAYAVAPPYPGPGYGWVDGYYGPRRNWVAGYWNRPYGYGSYGNRYRDSRGDRGRDYDRNRHDNGNHGRDGYRGR